jgi:alkanesulfonate monooxygenase SsuD/methylene tetrahydromethanopterin reductase-like flavin-dependent oxidoreductase (luciferase family)
MRLKIGLYIATTFHAADDMPTQTNHLVEQVRHAKANGFASLWAGQHFLTNPLQMVQPVPLLARLLPEADGMMIGPNILVLPILNPVAVAEESLTMDLLSGGHYTLGIGLGYRDEEYAAFNIRKNERTARLEEAIHVIRRLWNEAQVSHQGQYYTVPNAGVGLRPIRPGGPPIWIAASAEPAIERAARLGDAWLITFYTSITLLKDQIAFYRDCLRLAGKPEPDDMPILKECYVGTSNKTALDECQGPLQVKYNAYASWGQDKFLPKGERFDQPFEDFVQDRFLIGDIAFVRDEIQRYCETLGVNHFILRVHWPGLDQSKVLRTIDLIGKYVIPTLPVNV